MLAFHTVLGHLSKPMTLDMKPVSGWNPRLDIPPDNPERLNPSTVLGLAIPTSKQVTTHESSSVRKSPEMVQVQISQKEPLISGGAFMRRQGAPQTSKLHRKLERFNEQQRKPTVRFSHQMIVLIDFPPPAYPSSSISTSIRRCQPF